MRYPDLKPCVLALAMTAACVTLAAAAPLGLDEAVRRAVRAHPALAAARLDARAADARVRDADRRPAPALAAEVEDVGGRAGADGVQSTLALTQTFERGGDRAARTGAARAVAALAGADLDALALEVAAEAAEAFLGAWTLQQQLALERDAEAQARLAVHAAGERLRAGAAPAFERARAEGFAALRALEGARTEAALAAARRRLARLWDADSLDADSLALAEPAAGLPALEALRARGAAHPGRRRAAAAADEAEWRLREARAARASDLDASAGVRRLPEDGGNALVASVSMALPLWGRADGAVIAATAERDAARARAAAAGRHLDRELALALDALRAAEETWRLARGPVREAADEALRLVGEAYRGGRLGYAEIAESQRSRLESERLRIEAHAAVWRARAAVERLTGTPLDAAGEAR